MNIHEKALEAAEKAYDDNQDETDGRSYCYLPSLDFAVQTYLTTLLDSPDIGAVISAAIWETGDEIDGGDADIKSQAVIAAIKKEAGL